jgi:Domain of unknown function (DUF4350)
MQAVRRASAGVSLPEMLLIVLAIAALVTLSVLERTQKAAEAPDSYSTYDTTSGGYKAFYELLGREGIRVERFEQRPAFLDDSTDTLVYAEPLSFDPRQVASTKQDAYDVEAWVRRGGRLLYLGFDDAAAKEKILALPQSALKGTAQPIVIDPALRDAGVTKVGVFSSGRRWKMNGRHLLVDDGWGPAILTYPFGKGTVTAIIDQTVFDDENLAIGDRARLALALAAPGRARGIVAFDETIHGYLTPEHWWQIIPRPFAIALGIALVALLVALGGAMLRLGPPIVPRVRDDRTSSDFIDALSALLERGHASPTVLAEAVTSATRSIARGVGAGDDATPAQVAERIESPQGRADFREMTYLAQSGAYDPKNLVRAVALAQRLRKEFAPHGR